MFHSAALKLTLWYLAIIIAISLVFSVSLYRVSSDDLYRNVNRQIGYFNNLLGPDEGANYRVLRDKQLDQDINHLRTNLIFFNILVLVGGGAASYWLARRTLEPIEMALENQTRFASDASHELRTPLTAIMTENEVALRSNNLTKSQATTLLKSNLEEVAKLKALSEGLLRLANGNGHIDNPQPVPLNKVIASAIERYSKAAKAKKIQLIDKVGDQKVVGDADSLTEVASILIDNAIKYSEEGSPVKLTTEKHNKNISLKVSDRGSGIKPTELPLIFDRFYRIDSSRSKQSEGGYGLGLAIAKKIVDAHHGHIEVSSTPGKGTVFTVVLPSA